MARNLIVSHPTDGRRVLTEHKVAESVLQNELKNNPDLLPVDEFDLPGPMLVVGRETVLASGKADLLGVTRSGDIVIVEFKTGPDNPDFRHALAQALDYGADLWQMSYEQFDSVTSTYFRSAHCPKSLPSFGSPSLLAAAEATWADLDEATTGQFIDRITHCLERGAFHYVIAAQRFTTAMAKSAEYLSAAQPESRFFLVETVAFSGLDITAMEARTVFRPGRSRPGQSASGFLSEHQFLETIADEAYRDALADLFEHCRSLGLRFEWGTKGTSIRVSTAYRADPFSLGWVFPSTGGWMGLRDVTFGYLTGPKQQETPEPLEALNAFTNSVAQVAGATPVTATNVNGVTFQPANFTAAVPMIKHALDDLVATLAGDE